MYINGSFNGTGRHRFADRKSSIRRNDRVPNGLEEDVVVSRDFSVGDGSAHDVNGLLKVGTVGRFSRQHDGIGSIVHGIGDIGTLGSGGTRILDHGFQHLRGSNDHLTGNVCLSDHKLLCQKHFGGWDFHSQISSGNHDSVRFFENFVVVLESLLVFNFANDFDLRPSIVCQEFTQITNVLSGPDKGCGDEFHALFDSKIDNIVDILVGKGRKFDCNSG
mmetsp:Transcript_10764/g.19797  ORF Transcript_10764/g.19797 Transcript_10764/m.19797 type:complete len:219 (+) Transcript_10764:454-1110(+)